MKIIHRLLQGTAWSTSARSLDQDRGISRIRIVLGGVFMPLAAGSWLKRIALLLLPVLLALAMGLVERGNNADGAMAAVWQSWAGGFTSFWAQLCSLGLITLAVLQLRLHWCQPDHGLSTLALLPQLGNPPQVHRDLLSAAILPPLRWLIALGVIAVLASISASRGALAALLAFASLFGNGLTLITLALYTFSGRKLPRLALVLILASLALLSLLGFGLPDWLSHRGVIAAAAGIPFFGLLWLSYYGAMAWMLLLGWANLFDRPHPFLPNAC